MSKGFLINTQLNCTAVQYLLLVLIIDFSAVKKLEKNGNFKNFFVGDYIQ